MMPPTSQGSREEYGGGGWASTRVGEDERVLSYPGLWKVLGLREGLAKGLARQGTRLPTLPEESLAASYTPPHSRLVGRKPEGTAAAQFKDAIARSLALFLPAPRRAPLIWVGPFSTLQLRVFPSWNPEGQESLPHPSPPARLGDPLLEGPEQTERPEFARRIPGVPTQAGSAFASLPQQRLSRSPGCWRLSGNNPFGPSRLNL